MPWCVREYTHTHRSFSLTQSRNGLSIDDREHLVDLRAFMSEVTQGLGSGEGVSRMRAPLQLALLISPIYLLLPIQLYKRSFSRQTMLHISESLGNRKPRILEDVEIAIWKTLISIATDRMDPIHYLQQLSDSLPWEDLKNSLCSEPAWFSTGRLHCLTVSFCFKCLSRFSGL